MSHAISHVMPVTFPMLSVGCDALHIVERGERERLAVSHNETGTQAGKASPIPPANEGEAVLVIAAKRTRPDAKQQAKQSKAGQQSGQGVY
jgi:hypothetical protein